MSSPSKKVATTVLWLAPFAVLCINMGQTVLFATMPMLGRAWGFNEVQITSLVSLSALTYFLVSPAWGRASDRIGRKNAILIGLIGYAVGTLLFNFIGYAGLVGALGGWALYLVLLPYRIFHTGFMAAAHPASSAYVADVTTINERTRGMSMIAAAIATGVMLGPALVYFARFGLLMPLYISTVITFGAAFVLWRYMPDYRLNRNKLTSIRLHYFDSRFSRLLTVGLMMYVMLAMVQQTLGFYLQDRLDLDFITGIRYYALLNMYSSLAMVAMQFLVVRRVSLSPMTFLKIGLPVAGLAYVLLGLSHSFSMMALAMVVLGIGMGLSGPGYTAGVSLCVSREEQGALAGLAGSIPGLGFVIGPLLGAMLYGLDIAWPALFAALAMLILSFWVWFFLHIKALNRVAITNP